MELAGQKFIEAFSSGKFGHVCLEVPDGERAIDFHDDNDMINNEAIDIV